MDIEQLRNELTGSTSNNISADVEERLKKVITTQTTRKVILKYVPACLCPGFDDFMFERDVPIDSPLKDGDIVDRFIPGDREI